MKKQLSKKFQIVHDLKVHIISGVALLVLSSTVAFAWNSNTRLTRLETALISLSADVHDIKALLEKGRGLR